MISLRRFSTFSRHCKPAKLANLGGLIDVIHSNTPDLIQRTYPDEILDPDITLRLLPDTHPHLPSVSGRATYKASFKLVQLLVSTLLVPVDSKLEILSSRLQDHNRPYNYLHSQGQAHTHGHNHGHIGHLRKDPYPAEPTLVSPEPPKLFIRWRTIQPPEATATTTATTSSSANSNSVASPSYINYSWSSSLSKIDPRNLGILPEEYPVLTGIFMFEFSSNCTSILVHTITDLEYLTSPTPDAKVVGV